MSELFWQDAVELREAVAGGERTAAEVIRAFLERTEARAGELGAVVHLDTQGALERAEDIDRRRAAGETLGPLAGVVVPLKDNICVRGVPTTCGSRMLASYRPPYDAHVVQRLRAADAVLVAKTNMDEFAMGSSSETSVHGPTRNPWDTERTPGGSSGGSAAVVAAGLAPVSLGSDTGGSVRQPGALCGVTALKPTYGRVSRSGLVAFASSLDQIGPFARTARDAARLLSVIAGVDRRDATSVDAPVHDYEAACSGELAGLRVGVVRDPADEGADDDVIAAVEAAIDVLRGLGAEIRDVTLPHARHAVSVYYLVAPAEASSNLARYDGVRYGLRVERDGLADTYAATRAAGFGPEVQRRIMLGTYALSAGYYDAFYLKAQRVRTLIRRDYDAAFGDVDVLVGPTSPTPAFRLGERTDDPLAMYLADVYTLPASLAGLPAMSVPCGFTDGGLPVGLQLTAPAFEEARLVRAADAYQRATDWHRRRPPAFAG